MPFLPLSLEQHANAGFIPSENYSFTASHPLVPAYLHEHTLLSKTMPLCFIKLEDKYLFMALAGTTEAGCVFLRNDGQWTTPYVPVALRGQPFSLRQTPDGEKLVLCIDDTALTDGSSGERIFNNAGKLSESVTKTMDLLTQRQSVIKPTQDAVDKLAHAGVLKEWDLTLKSAEGVSKAKGLYTVDQTALNELTAEAYHTLQGNPMTLAHAQLFSMRNVQLLNVLIEQKFKHKTEDFDLDQFFDSSNDTLKFDL